jgi:ABC-type phosphate transport system ATPase subunit
MIEIDKIEFKTNSVFDLTEDLDLIEQSIGMNFTQPNEFLFMTKEEYLENTLDVAKVIDMLTFVEEVLEDPSLFKLLEEKYRDLLDAFFNE